MKIEDIIYPDHVKFFDTGIMCTVCGKKWYCKMPILLQQYEQKISDFVNKHKGCCQPKIEIQKFEQGKLF